MSSSDTPHDPPPPDPPRPDLSASGVTIPSDSENYGNNELSSPSPPSTDSSPLILYKPPTVWSLVRGAAINLLLPFINGLMLGFGELFAHEIAFQLGWSTTKVRTGGKCAWATGARGGSFGLTERIGVAKRTIESFSRAWDGSPRRSCGEEKTRRRHRRYD